MPAAGHPEDELHHHVCRRHARPRCDARSCPAESCDGTRAVSPSHREMKAPARRSGRSDRWETQAPSPRRGFVIRYLIRFTAAAGWISSSSPTVSALPRLARRSPSHAPPHRRILPGLPARIMRLGGDRVDEHVPVVVDVARHQGASIGRKGYEATTGREQRIATQAGALHAAGAAADPPPSLIWGPTRSGGRQRRSGARRATGRVR